MIDIERSFTIHRPLEDVFDYMSRFENDAEWRAEIADIRRSTSLERGVGERYEQLLDIGGRQVMTDFEVVEYEQNRHLAFRGTSGDVKARGAYDFTAEGDATHVDVHATVDVSGAAQLTEPYMKRQLATHGDEDFRRLRRLLESRA
jgi:uncharacterized membrane protein